MVKLTQTFKELPAKKPDMYSYRVLAAVTIAFYTMLQVFDLVGIVLLTVNCSGRPTTADNCII